MGVFVDPTGDILVVDLGNQRVNRYHSNGEPAGSFRIDLSAGVPTRWEMSTDGRLMAQLRGLDMPGMAALPEGDPIVIYDTTGVVVDTLTVLPKGQMIEGISQEGVRMRIFAPEPLWDLAPDGTVYTAMNDRFQILVSSPEGQLTRIIRKDVERKPVEESDRNAILRAMREQLTQFGMPSAQLEQFMQGIAFAEFYPAFGQIFVGPTGNLWVQRIRSAKDMAGEAGEAVEFDAQAVGSPEWEIYDTEGRYLGVVTLPDRFTPMTAAGDELYGIWLDDLDVQYVMRAKVDRPS
jgi:hypothetical protein